MLKSVKGQDYGEPGPKSSMQDGWDGVGVWAGGWWQQLKVKWQAASSNEERGNTNIGSLTVKAEMREGLYSFSQEGCIQSNFLRFQLKLR